MAKLHLSQPGMNFSLSVSDEVLTEYLKHEVMNLDISQKFALLSKIKKGTKGEALTSIKKIV